MAADRSFDYYCWDLYTKVGLFYRDGNPSGEPNPEKLKLRSEVLHALEEGNNAIAELADYVATRNVERILDTMERLGIRYDLLARESDILHLHFWDRAFELMKQAGVIHLDETEGRNRGCWVMPFESHTGTDEHESDKIIVRSNGTVTYTGKDIAYQLWKLGQLGLDFHSRPFRRYPRWAADVGRQPFWTPTPKTSSTSVQTSGAASLSTTWFDSRPGLSAGRSVLRGVAALVPQLGREASVHFGYEMVASVGCRCATNWGYRIER